ncbi:MAG: GDCCVxC domain-containing (seleno)protein [Rhodospirillaceae bacterium]|nr:GDCCVxC domain-containing (seleno)protein [Rhodospirillaceae bacterium]
MRSPHITLIAAITCPACNHKSQETMPTDACLYFYSCKGCGLLLKPKSGDCCVFCSYGTNKCPSVQAFNCVACPS